MRMRKFILFLVRKRLGVKKYEGFQFANQQSENDWYFFGMSDLWKMDHSTGREQMIESGASLNWLLSDECKGLIRKNGLWWPQFIDEEE